MNPTGKGFGEVLIEIDGEWVPLPNLGELSFEPEEAPVDPERVCHECGNDLAAEGFIYCTDCIETLNASYLAARKQAQDWQLQWIAAIMRSVESIGPSLLQLAAAFRLVAEALSPVSAAEVRQLERRKRMHVNYDRRRRARRRRKRKRGA